MNKPETPANAHELYRALRVAMNDPEAANLDCATRTWVRAGGDEGIHVEHGFRVEGEVSDGTRAILAGATAFLNEQVVPAIGEPFAHTIRMEGARLAIDITAEAAFQRRHGASLRGLGALLDATARAQPQSNLGARLSTAMAEAVADIADSTDQITTEIREKVRGLGFATIEQDGEGRVMILHAEGEDR